MLELIVILAVAHLKVTNEPRVTIRKNKEIERNLSGKLGYNSQTGTMLKLVLGQVNTVINRN